MLLLRLPEPDRHQVRQPEAQSGVGAATVLLRLVDESQQEAGLLRGVAIVVVVDDLIVVLSSRYDEPERLPCLMEELQSKRT